MCDKCGCSTQYGKPKVTRGIDCHVADIVEEVYGKGLANASEGDVQVVNGDGDPVWVTSGSLGGFWEFYDYNVTGGLIEFSGNVGEVGELRFTLPASLGNVNGFANCSLSLVDNTSPQDSQFIAFNTATFPPSSTDARAIEIDLDIDGVVQVAHIALPVTNRDILFRVDGLGGTDPLDVDYELKVYMLRRA